MQICGSKQLSAKRTPCDVLLRKGKVNFIRLKINQFCRRFECNELSTWQLMPFMGSGLA